VSDPVLTLATGRSELRVNGCRLETLWLTAPTKVPVTWVLLHEGLGCVELWRDFPAQLHDATGDAVFAWSRRGYGLSDAVPLPRPLNYMTDEAEHHVGPVLDQVPGEHILLLGHSDGASIAALYAAIGDDSRVAGVLLVAPHFFTEQIALTAIAQTSSAYENGNLKARLQKYHHDNVECAFKGWSDAWLAKGFRQWDITNCLPKIDMPMVLVQGQQDEYGTMAQLDAASTLSRGDCQRFELPNCDHWPHLKAPDSLLAASAALRTMAI